MSYKGKKLRTLGVVLFLSSVLFFIIAAIIASLGAGGGYSLVLNVLAKVLNVFAVLLIPAGIVVLLIGFILAKLGNIPSTIISLSNFKQHEQNFTNSKESPATNMAKTTTDIGNTDNVVACPNCGASQIIYKGSAVSCPYCNQPFTR